MHQDSDPVIQMNDHIRELTVNKAEMLSRDWRDVALRELPLNEEQAAYIRALPEWNVGKIQEIVDSVLRKGGEIKFEKTQEGGTSLTAIHAQPTGPNPLINLKICSFDAFFKNCKWFPK
jgi:hypothetical protein